MTGIRRALMFSSLERYLVLAAAFVSLAAISRILTPGEVGVSVLGVAVMMFLQSIREFSSPIYLIQRTDLTQRDIRGFVTLQALAAVLIFTAAVASASLISAIYSAPDLVPYLRVIAICILVEAASRDLL
jgi:O-antigen/teichoic acid export membrane protein